MSAARLLVKTSRMVARTLNFVSRERLVITAHQLTETLLTSVGLAAVRILQGLAPRLVRSTDEARG